MELEQLKGLKLDEYTLDTLIGRGGMSAVYRAFQEELERWVAIKILSGAMLLEPGYLERFDREAKMAASLEHPHIVPIYDYGVHDNLSYVVMRLLTGGTLLDRINAGRVPADQVSEILAALAKALDYGHSRGIIHRDIKPGNVMFDSQDTVYLVDFGIAKALTGNQTDLSLTAPNIVMGTPAYIAPEQWQSQPLTPAVDQYALAIVVYRALTGELPFKADDPGQLMQQHMNDAPTPVHLVNASVPPSVSDVLDKALSKRPYARYDSVLDFSSAFRDALENPVATATIPTPAVPDIPEVPGSSEPTIQSATFALPEESQVEEIPPDEAQEALPDDPVQWQQPEEPLPAAQPIITTQPDPDSSFFMGSIDPDIDVDSGNKTIMMQIASGGVLGLVLLAGLFVVGAGVILFLLRPDETPDELPVTSDPVSILVTNAPNNEPTTQITEPTLTPLFGSVLQETPVVTYAGMTPAQLRETDVLYSRGTTTVNDAVFSPDNKMVAAAHGDGLIRLWWNGVDASPIVLNGHTDVVSALDFSADGAVLASGGRDGTVRLWNTATGELIVTLTGHTASVRDVAFSNDGQLASAAEDNTIRLWNLQTGRVRLTINDSSRVLAVDFSPNGKLVASGGRTGSVNVWSAETGGLQASLSGHEGEVRSVAFSPDGNLLASSSIDDTIRIWDVGVRRVVNTLTGHGNDVWVVTFNPDGTLLASGGRNNDLRVWDVATGNGLAALRNHAGWVLGVDFSPDGTTIVTGSGDGSVRLWRSS